MAIVVIGSGVAALPALLAFLAAYALANLLAFAVVTHLRGRTDFEDYHGLVCRQPLVTAALIVALLSLVGIPPLVGFFGKFLLFEVTIEAGRLASGGCRHQYPDIALLLLARDRPDHVQDARPRERYMC